MAYYYMDYPAILNYQYLNYLPPFDTTQIFQDKIPIQIKVKQEFCDVPLIKIEDIIKQEHIIVEEKPMTYIQPQIPIPKSIPLNAKNVEKKTKKIKFSKTPIQQNPFRNIHTNIGNQIITFLYIQKKSLQTIKICFPDLPTSEVKGYYEYSLNIKKSINGYINREKLKRIWHKKDIKPKQIYYHHMLRTLSYYYLTHHAIMSILTSKKISRQTLNEHMKIRRNLVKLLSNEQAIET